MLQGRSSKKLGDAPSDHEELYPECKLTLLH
jgi:hypothetical protein